MNQNSCGTNCKKILLFSVWEGIRTCSKMHQTTSAWLWGIEYIVVIQFHLSCTVSTCVSIVQLFCEPGMLSGMIQSMWLPIESSLQYKGRSRKVHSKASLENLHSVVKTGLCNAAICKTQAVSDLFVRILECLMQGAIKNFTAHRFFFSITGSWACKEKLWFPFSSEIWTLLYIPDP